MKAILVAAVMLTGCATYPEPLPPDTSSIVGNWRETRLDGRRVSNGYALAISTFSSFAAQNVCVGTGVMLRASGPSRYRIERYETGFGTEGCRPLRAGP